MISDSRLQIKLLSKSGELLNCVNCFPSQITVLRANAENDLLPYQRALAGIPGPERFSILLDREVFVPNDNVLVGFGEKLPAQAKISDLFGTVGLNGDALFSVLLSYGLESSMESSCSQLSECAARRVQLLLAAYSSAKVFIFNDPFEPISSNWRERIADLILNDAVTKHRVTILPRLSYRPQCWVGNEAVARIQVGTTIQKTIGFASDSTDVNSMVNKMRELLKDENAVKQLIESQAVRVPSTPVRHPSATNQTPGDPVRHTSGAFQSAQKPLQSWEADPNARVHSEGVIRPEQPEQAAFGLSPWKQRILSFCDAIHVQPRLVATLAGACIVLIIVVLDRSHAPTPVQIAKNRVKVTAKPKGEVVKVPSMNGTDQTMTAKGPKQGEQIVTVSNIVPPNIEPPKPQFLLDFYPPEIKQAIMAAFDSSSSSVGRESAVYEHKPIQPHLSAEQAKSPFADLKSLPSSAAPSAGAEYASDPGFNPNYQGDNNPQADVERQEQIRQKFLEAINRAVEARQENMEPGDL